MPHRFEIKVIPRAKRNEVVEKNGIFVVRVTAPADDGKANAAVIVQLSQYWKIPKSYIRIVRGVTSRNKLFEILDSKKGVE